MIRTTMFSARLGLSIWLVLMGAVGCKTPVSIGGSNGGGGGGGTTASGGSGGSTANGGSGGATGHPFHQINCLIPCSTVDDCTDGLADTDVDNHECVAGACVWKGCNDDQECSSVYGAGYVCALTPHATIRACTRACTTPADCDGGNPAHDADNYACVDGACDYLGCSSDAECSDTFGAGFQCVQFQGVLGKECWQGCQTSADCDLGSPALSSDNFACNEGICDYTSCHDDAECQATFQGTSCFEHD